MFEMYSVVTSMMCINHVPILPDLFNIAKIGEPVDEAKLWVHEDLHVLLL